MAQTLKINGTEKQFPDGEMPANISELLSRMDIDQATVVAEIDGTIIKRKNFSETDLTPGQTIELIRFVGGG